MALRPVPQVASSSQAVQVAASSQALSFGVDITAAFGRRQEAADCGQGAPCCYEAGEGGATLRVTGHCYEGRSFDEDRCAQSHVVVWDDEEGICKPGHKYVHYVFHELARPMTAGAGKLIHTMKACFFDVVPVNATGCQPFSGGRACRSGIPILEWRVARAGYSCTPN